jgi:hypothetical protein
MTRPPSFQRTLMRLVAFVIASIVGASLCSSPAMAQERPAVTAPDTAAALAAFRRAQRQVNDGNGAPGRAIVDSLVEVAEPGSAAEAQALFWRATLAPTWPLAQRDYLRVMLEHERSPLAAASMFRLAQGELAGGDRAAAQRYFERLTREAPESPIRAEASLWHGRMLIERGAKGPGCGVLREGRRRVTATQFELVNQYDYLLQGCPAETPTATPSATTTAPAPLASSAAARWSVQLAAFQTRREAEAMVRRLRARGYTELRIDGEAAPYRVRLGRYATRDEAQRALAAYRRKEKADGFITPVPAR